MNYLAMWLLCGFLALLFSTWFYGNTPQVRNDYTAPTGVNGTMMVIWVIMFIGGPLSFLVMGSVKLYEVRLAHTKRQLPRKESQ